MPIFSESHYCRLCDSGAKFHNLLIYFFNPLTLSSPTNQSPTLSCHFRCQNKHQVSKKADMSALWIIKHGQCEAGTPALRVFLTDHQTSYWLSNWPHWVRQLNRHKSNQTAEMPNLRLAAFPRLSEDTDTRHQQTGGQDNLSRTRHQKHSCRQQKGHLLQPGTVVLSICSHQNGPFFRFLIL